MDSKAIYYIIIFSVLLCMGIWGLVKLIQNARSFTKDRKLGLPTLRPVDRKRLFKIYTKQEIQNFKIKEISYWDMAIKKRIEPDIFLRINSKGFGEVDILEINKFKNYVYKHNRMIIDRIQRGN